MKMSNKYLAFVLVFLAFGCSKSSDVKIGMYPDYRNVLVPCNIAPLNFYYSGAKGTTTFTVGDMSYTVKGRDVCIPIDQWKKLTESAKGKSIDVHSSLMGDWSIYVSPDSIDSYLTYRLLEPAYEVSNMVEIYERNITNFDERMLSSYYNTANSCMNCHIHKSDNSFFYLRGSKGGAILSRKGALRKLNLRTDAMFTGTVYGDLNPDGRWGVFSYNKVIPSFHTMGQNRLEVYDSMSDICLVDFDSNRIVLPSLLTRVDVLETFPCFGADGRSIYYCAADTLPLPQDIKKLRYSLFKVDFNPNNGEIGTPVSIWDAQLNAGSVCHPKASPDGKWMLFTVSDYGTFPIWHRECDLQMMNLLDGSFSDMSQANSDWSDTYHSWSSNSRWFVFASKRGDGQYGKPYICHVDEVGEVSKAFVLPQANPHFYDNTLKSFNIPDLGAIPAKFTVDDIGRIRSFVDAEAFQ